MDPSQNPVPSPNVPPRATPELGTTMPLPAGSAAPVQAGPQSPAGQSPVTPLTPPAAAPGFLPPVVPVQPPTAQPVVAADPNGTGTTADASHPAAPPIADDGDLIEKEWVHKAKLIVERTRSDPYKQTKELHAFKADYMKKRYNKTIGAVDD